MIWANRSLFIFCFAGTIAFGISDPAPKFYGDGLINLLPRIAEKINIGTCKRVANRYGLGETNFEVRFACPKNISVVLGVFNETKEGWYLNGVSIDFGFTPKQVFFGKHAEQIVSAFIEGTKQQMGLKCKAWESSDGKLTQRCLTAKGPTSNWHITKTKSELFPKTANDIYNSNRDLLILIMPN